jgi:L-lactate dehydrogenase (cytochrome)
VFDRRHSILDLRGLARRRLPSPVLHFLDGAAETEATAERNTSAFDEVKLIPRCLVDVTSVRTATRVLGQDLEWPVFCSPAGGSRTFHPEGELAVARAAARTGMLYGLSTTSSYSLEEVAVAGSGLKRFPLYIFQDRDATRELIGRCKRSEYKALCLTVDVPTVRKREQDLRTGFAGPIRPSLSSFASFARRPGCWSLKRLRDGPLTLSNLTERAGSTSLVAQTRFSSSRPWSTGKFANAGQRPT